MRTSTTTLPPSGEQILISRGEQQAIIVTVGGGIRSYRVGDTDVLDGYPEDATADGARGQTLIPWPNRVQDGKWNWQGVDLQLALTEPDQHNAIHGLVRSIGWNVSDRTPDGVTVDCVSWPQMGYPWPLHVSVRYQLHDDGLRVTHRVTNCGTNPAPVAAGAHPYLTVGTTTVNEALLHVPADAWINTDDQQIPTETCRVDQTPFDFRVPRLIGDTKIDYTFTQLHREEEGRFILTMKNTTSGRAVRLWVDRNYDYIEVFTGDTLPDESRRRRGLGVEPMTAPPNALASGTSLNVLEPGQTWTGRWGLSPA